MAGRIVPIAIAGVSGIAIGVAVFDSEFKKQRKQKLEEEYQREVAALALANGEKPPAAKIPAAAPQIPQTLSKPTEESKPSGLSSVFGLWAWKGTGSSESTSKEPQQTRSVADEPKR